MGLTLDAYLNLLIDYLVGMILLTVVTLAYTLLGGTGLTSATVIGVLSGLAWGLGYFGPPHIAVRFIALRKPQEAASARRIGVTWQIISLSGAVFAGLIGIAYIEQRGIDLGDPEAPIIVLSLYWQKLTNWGALAAMVVGAVTVFTWSAAEVSDTALGEPQMRSLARR
ncbi:MAG: sodium:solute symporter family transporter [Brevibacterium yomogidense]